MKTEISIYDCMKFATIQGQQIVDQCTTTFGKDPFESSPEFIDFMTFHVTKGMHRRYWDIPLGSADLALIEAVKLYRAALIRNKQQAAVASRD